MSLRCSDITTWYIHTRKCAQLILYFVVRHLLFQANNANTCECGFTIGHASRTTLAVPYVSLKPLCASTCSRREEAGRHTLARFPRSSMESDPRRTALYDHSDKTLIGKTFNETVKELREDGTLTDEMVTALYLKFDEVRTRAGDELSESTAVISHVLPAFCARR